MNKETFRITSNKMAVVITDDFGFVSAVIIDFSGNKPDISKTVYTHMFDKEKKGTNIEQPQFNYKELYENFKKRFGERPFRDYSPKVNNFITEILDTAMDIMSGAMNHIEILERGIKK